MDFPLSRYFYDDTDKNFVVFICVNKIRDVDTYSTQKAKFSVKVKLWTFFFRFPVISLQNYGGHCKKVVGLTAVKADPQQRHQFEGSGGRMWRIHTTP